MRRTDLYVKVELILDARDNVQKIAQEICRQIERVYEVKSAEVQNISERE
jgi:hypothetical protein